MLKKLKKYYAGLRSMSRPAYLLIKYCLIASCFILVLSLITFVFAGRFSTYTYELYYLGKSLFDAPVGILLVAAIGSVCIEERVKQ